MFKILEKKIKGKFIAIKNHTETPASSGIAVMINKMKTIDEPSYDSLLAEYKTILDNIKK